MSKDGGRLQERTHFDSESLENLINSLLIDHTWT